MRAALDLAGDRIAPRVHRQREALPVDEAVGRDVFLELAVIGRDFVVPVGVEVAAKAGDEPIGVALEMLVAEADVEQVARVDEAVGAVGDLRDVGRVSVP